MKYGKSILKYSIMATFALLAIGCGGKQEVQAPKEKILDVSAFKNDGNKTANFVMEQFNNKETIFVKVPKGEQIPLKLKLENNFLSLKTSNNYLIAKQDIYVLISYKALMFSPNANEWCNIDDYKCIKELFLLKENSFSIGFSADENGANAQVSLIQTK